MKKVVLIIMLVAACTVNIQAQMQKKTDWEEQGLKGRVKSVREIIYNAEEKFGEPTKGTLWREKLMKFNEKGNLIEENTSWKHAHKTIYKYDEKGNRIKWSYYKSDGSLTAEYTYKYDEKGNMIEENKYNSDGSLDTKSTYEYDEKGNTIRNAYYSDGSLTAEYTYKYDEKGNEVEQYSESDGSSYRQSAFKYDEKGNMIRRLSYLSDNDLYSQSSYKYDEKGNMIENSTNYHSGDNLDYVNTYEYKYDNKGNWVEKISYSEKTGKRKEPYQITERTIEYYE